MAGSVSQGPMWRLILKKPPGQFLLYLLLNLLAAFGPAIMCAATWPQEKTDVSPGTLLAANKDASERGTGSRISAPFCGFLGLLVFLSLGFHKSRVWPLVPFL